MVIAPLSQNIILIAQSKHSSQKIPLQSFFNTVFDLPKRSPIQSYFSGVQNPNLFLWLLGDLPGGRQPSQEKKPFRMLQKAQEDSPNEWKQERDLGPLREQKALKTGRKQRKPQVSLAICHFLKITQPKIFLKKEIRKSGFSNNLNDAEKKFKYTCHMIHKTQHFTLFNFSENIFSSVFFLWREDCSSIYPLYVY